MVWSFCRKPNLNATLKLDFCQQQPAEPVHRHHQQLRTWSQWTPPSQTPRHLGLAWHSTLSGADHEFRNRRYGSIYWHVCVALGSLEIVEELVDGGLERRQRQLRQLCVLARVEATRVYNIINIILIAKTVLRERCFCHIILCSRWLPCQHHQGCGHHQHLSCCHQITIVFTCHCSLPTIT